MKILDADIDWMERCGNDPRIKILVDRMPRLEELTYQQKGSLYFGELDGYVSFFFYQQPDEGYGGRHFDINMMDGSQKTLIGPWSSCSSVMNDAGFTPCTEVSITDDPEVWKRGHTFFAAAATVEILEPAMKLCYEYPSWFDLHKHEFDCAIQLEKAYNNSRETIYTPKIRIKGGGLIGKNH